MGGGFCPLQSQLELAMTITGQVMTSSHAVTRYQNLQFIPNTPVCQLGDAERKVLSLPNYRDSSLLSQM